MEKALLKVMGVVLAIGGTSAAAVDTTSHPGTWAPTVSQQALVMSAVGGYYTPQGAATVGLAHVDNLVLPSAASGVASSSNATQIDLSPARRAGSSPSRTSGTAAGQQGGRYLVPIEAVPKPSGGAMLLCGLAVLVFIARRKTRPVGA